MRLGQLLADYRFANRLGIRAVATEIGMSPASLSRIENGKSCDSENIAKLMLWLFTEGAQQKRAKPKGTPDER